MLYFFEVRTVKDGLSDPFETITESKKNKFFKSAEQYIVEVNWNGAAEIGYIGIDMSCNPPDIKCILDYE